MSLFLAYRQHFPETCPARDLQLGAMLGDHISGENARKAGSNFQGEAVVDGEHTLYPIQDAAHAEAFEQFMIPFTQVKQVQVWVASSCVDVIARRGF